jgi:large subunit ribosomal protein L6
MSKIGRKPIEIPSSVSVSIDGLLVNIRGPKGSLSLKIADKRISVSRNDGEVIVGRTSDEKKVKALHGLYRMLINNMIVGVTEGYKKELNIVGLGYRAQMKGNDLVLSVGYSNPVTFTPPDGISISLKSPTRIVVEGADKALVGQVSASIRSIRPPDAYKGAGIRYADEEIKLKPGKGAKKKE